MHSTRSRYVRRRYGDSLKFRYVLKTVKYRGFTILLWCAIKGDSTRILVRCPNRGNMNSTVYQDILTNEIDLIGKCLVFPQQSFIFQHDNAPCQRSASTVSFLEDHNICLLDWPANSSDAHPIENLWHII